MNDKVNDGGAIAEDQISVEVMVEGRARWSCELRMTRDEYKSWCEQIDTARGDEQEQTAEELLELGRVDIYRDMDIESMRVEDFVEIKARGAQ